MIFWRCLVIFTVLSLINSAQADGWQQFAADIKAIHDMKKGTFQSTEKFEEDKQKAKAALAERLHKAAEQGDIEYQAGIATMIGYDADNSAMKLSLVWHEDFLKLIPDLKDFEGTVIIDPAIAKANFADQPSHPFFTTIVWSHGMIELESVGLNLEGTLYPISHDLRSGESFKDCNYCPEMVWLPENDSFIMGTPESDNAKDSSDVNQSAIQIIPFAISKYEVTFAEYDHFMEVTNRRKPDDWDWGRENRPVVDVSWEDATAYAEWLSAETGEEYRLPTEAEWEYAAKSGTVTPYWWGNHIGLNQANCDGCGSNWDKRKTAPVGSFPANAFGLHDTVGNVWEWTCSDFSDPYDGSERRCIDKDKDKDKDNRPVIRGGSWYNIPVRARATFRAWNYPVDRAANIGFRLVRM